MEIFDKYREYRKYKPQYKEWKNGREEIEAKRLAYIDKNNISAEQKKLDIKRAEAVLNAVDVMDEYSQSRAENQEVITEPAKNIIMQVIASVGAIVGTIIMAVKFAKKPPKELEKLLANPYEFIKIPTISSVIATIAGLPFVIGWATQKEVEASRIGRHEAMNTELSSAKQFAILSDEQEKERDEIARGIKIKQKEKKKPIAHMGGMGLFRAFNILTKPDEKYLNSKKEFDKKISDHQENFDKKQLSEKELEEAKKDQQLITNVIEKIDIASQDYAEDVELATNVFSLFALGGGGLSGFVTNKLLKSCNNPVKKFLISIGVGSAVTLVSTLFAAKLQKQASRVARFKVKQELLKNPEQLIYVDDEKTKEMDATNYKKSKKTSYIKFLKNILKDNNEYRRYLKSENVKEKQKRAAQEQITLSNEQERRARQLQMNVFKTFNKVDEQSQMYSESTEAMGETLKEFCSAAVGLPFISAIYKMPQMIDENANALNYKNIFKSLKPFLKAALFSAIPAMLLEIYVTKEQKNASRVADMRAIEGLSDPRHFADYTNAQERNFTSKQIPTPNKKYLLS